MLEQLGQFLATKISFFRLNILFLLGLAIFGGSIGGRLFQRLKSPQVVGYICIGILFGQSAFNIFDKHIVQIMQPFSQFALGLIGFMVGGELRRDVLAKYGKQFIIILLFESITAFIFVTLLVGWIGMYLFNESSVAWSVGLLLGAIASATAPAATTDVLWEYKTKGPLTTTVFGIVALDDVFGLALFAIVASFVQRLAGHTSSTLFIAIIQPIYEIGGSIIIGGVSGLILCILLRKYTDSDRILVSSLGAVLLVLGLSLAVNVDILLAAITLGIVVTNFIPGISKEIFKLVKGFAPPIYIIFFVLVGATLNIRHITPAILIFAFVYLIGRTIGKSMGARIGARISRVPETVQKYLPFCLLSQAGVAIGLSIIAYHLFPGEIGNNIVIMVTLTTLVVQIVGPPLVKFAVTKADEVNLDVDS